VHKGGMGVGGRGGKPSKDSGTRKSSHIDHQGKARARKLSMGTTVLSGQSKAIHWHSQGNTCDAARVWFPRRETHRPSFHNDEGGGKRCAIQLLTKPVK